MVDVFLRICSKVQRQMEDLCVFIYIKLTTVQSQQSWYVYQTLDEKRQEKNRSVCSQQQFTGFTLKPLLLDYSHLFFLMNSQ